MCVIYEENKSDMRIKKISSDFITPMKILMNYKPAALLESAYPNSGKSRYSIMVLDEAFGLAKKGKDYFRIRENEREKITGANDFLGLLNDYRKKAPEIPCGEDYPFPLGGLGYLGYEYFDEIEEIEFKKVYEDNEYDCYFIFGRNFLVFDHFRDEMVAMTVKYSGESTDIDSVFGKMIAKLEECTIRREMNPESVCRESEIWDEDDREEFCENVLKVKEEIENGNLIQCVISRTLMVKTGTDPRIFYRELRRENPSPYMFFLRCGELTLFGTSPEIMVKVSGRTAVLRPIAGTRKRGKDEEEDNRLQYELLSDRKERAEHIMLVDLARNDLGRTAETGSVEIDEYMSVEKYASVMHIVSNVKSTIEKDENSYSVIKACFPAGTVSGAPKIRAIKTVESLEKQRRGPYAGLVGYFCRNGDFDSCIAIRSAFCRNGFIRLQAGAGIVYDSDPQREYEETGNKLESLVKIFKKYDREEIDFEKSMR